MDKMTKKVAFGLAMDALETIDTEEARSAIEVIEKEIARLERAAAKAHSGETKADKEKAAFRQSVLDVLMDDAEVAMCATDIAKALDVTCQKVSMALKFLVESGRVMRAEGEKRVPMFSIASIEESNVE